jgi:hypothetical protein
MTAPSAHDDFRELRFLISQALDGSLSREDIERMEKMLESGSQLRAYYREYLSLYCDLTNLMGLQQLNPNDINSIQDKEFWETLANYENIAPVVETPKKPQERKLIEKVSYPPREKPAMSTFSIFSVALSAAAILLMAVFVRFAPPRGGIEVATVSDAMDAEWSSGAPLRPGTRLAANSNPIRLTRGIVKLHTDEQVEIILEAPSEFHFSSYSEVSMTYGKLFAHVSGRGYGFSVVTPNSKIVDLGTEFGVLSHIDGNTEVHMYKGKANIFADEKDRRKTSRLLTAGSAVKVDSQNFGIHDIALNEQALVRTIDSEAKLVWRGQKTLRLADLLLGGNGFGTASRQSIAYDPLTGAAIPVTAAISYRSGAGTFVSVPDSPFLDGLFIPGSGNGDTLVSSAGHRFEDCPKTSGMYYANFNCRKDWTFFEPLQQTFEQSRKQFQDPGLLYLHSNIGLTVDLNAVRRVVPGLRVSSFSAFAGIIRMGANKPDFSEADIWVLVDGEVKSSKKSLRADQGYDIHVEISDTDRFLTLVVTDGGKIYSKDYPANHFDTCGLAEPVFGLVRPQAAQQTME